MARDNAEDLVDPSNFPEEGGPDQTLNPSESTDSDEVRNADGDIVVDPPEHWTEADRIETTEGAERERPSLDDRLAAEEPDVLGDTVEDEGPGRTNRGQVSGTPEDGDSLFEVADE